MKPIRIQRRRIKGWRIPPNTVCVDRSTPFGNPFPVSKAKTIKHHVEMTVYVVGTWDGPAMQFFDEKKQASEMAVKFFHHWINQPPQNNLRLQAMKELKGKNLACWCKEGEPCHADVLLELAND